MSSCDTLEDSWPTVFLNGEIEIVQELIENGAIDIEKEDSGSITPLLFACKGGDIEIVKYLVGRGVNIKAQDWVGYTCLTYSTGNDEIFDYLLQIGVDVEDRDGRGWTQLMFACCQGDHSIIKYFLLRGADVNVKCEGGLSPISIACGYDRLEKCVIDTLIQYGADIEDRDDEGLTPLHCACEDGTFNNVEYLLQCGADIEVKDGKGMTPLMYALSHSGSYEYDDQIYSSYHDKLTFMNRIMETVIVLLDNGAILEFRDQQEYYFMRRLLSKYVLDYVNNRRDEMRESKYDHQGCTLISKLVATTIITVSGTCISNSDCSYSKKERLYPVAILMFACLRGNIDLVKDVLCNKYFIKDISKDQHLELIEYKEDIESLIPPSIKPAMRK